MERRQTPRAPGFLEGTWTGVSGSHPGVLGSRASRVSGLSVMGCFIESVTDMQLRDRIQLRLELPSGPLVVDAEVVHSERRMGFAVRFVDVVPETQKALMMAVEQLLARHQTG